MPDISAGMTLQKQIRADRVNIWGTRAAHKIVGTVDTLTVQLNQSFAVDMAKFYKYAKGRQFHFTLFQAFEYRPVIINVVTVLNFNGFTITFDKESKYQLIIHRIFKYSSIYHGEKL